MPVLLTVVPRIRERIGFLDLPNVLKSVSANFSVLARGAQTDIVASLKVLERRNQLNQMIDRSSFNIVPELIEEIPVILAVAKSKKISCFAMKFVGFPQQKVVRVVILALLRVFLGA